MVTSFTYIALILTMHVKPLTIFQVPTSSNLFVPRWWMFILHVQWNLFTMDTLGPAISGSLYRGFPLSEVKMY